MARAEFPPSVKEDLLVRAHRRCCVCHRYCGVKAEVDHIVPASEDGSAEPDNAILLCFDCHAEVHHYNTDHPKGTRFRPAELRRHREQWLELCHSKPEMFVHAMPPPDAGSLERLLGEIEYNQAVVMQNQVSGPMEVAQFRRAIADGTFTWVDGVLASALRSAYIAANQYNASLEALISRGGRDDNAAAGLLHRARAPLEAAVEALRRP